MTVYLSVEPGVIDTGECATWTIETDHPDAADAWWFGTGIDVGGSHVAGWYSPFYWAANYCYQGPWSGVRMVCVYDADGYIIECSNQVYFNVV